MLNFLSVENIVLIDKAEINFEPGLCILTGETGSGKSILLDALGLAIGFRFNLRLVGNNKNKAQIIAEFDISKNPNCRQILQENDLLDSENPQLLRIRRFIQKNVASKAYVNDVAVGMNLLLKIGATILEIHGQHEQSGLLNPAIHGDILDEFAQNQNLLKNLQKNYEQLKIAGQKIAKLRAKKELANREKDYLQYVISELKEAAIKPDEEEELIAKKNQLSAKEKILNFLSELKSHLMEANSQLIFSQKILIRNRNIIDNFLPENKAAFEELSTRLDQQNADLEAAFSHYENMIGEITDSENNVAEVEERLFYIRSLARKFNVKIEELPKIILQSEEKLQLIENDTKTTLELEQQILALAGEYKKIAGLLSKKRQKAALLLAKKVEAELKFLKMEDVRFLIEISGNMFNDNNNYGWSPKEEQEMQGLKNPEQKKQKPENNPQDLPKNLPENLEQKILQSYISHPATNHNDNEILSGDNFEAAFNFNAPEKLLYSPKGYDKVRFLAAINKNNFDDISKIASGGELSRFMLALRVALTEVRLVPTIIFDEIDAGIGGSTSDAVGKRLKILSEKIQVLVVTHQPQIAAKADLHFKISKISDGQKIKTIIEKLDIKKREAEIARMISGAQISQEAIAAATSLIHNS
jgi:DNA repair protein RecN (Recombination protein N)